MPDNQQKRNNHEAKIFHTIVCYSCLMHRISLVYKCWNIFSGPWKSTAHIRKWWRKNTTDEWFSIDFREDRSLSNGPYHI